MPAQPLKKISVLIVDDHPSLRAGVRAMLEKTPDIYVVGEAGSGDEAEKLLDELRPDYPARPENAKFFSLGI